MILKVYHKKVLLIPPNPNTYIIYYRQFLHLFSYCVYIHGCIGEEAARIKPEVVFDEEDGEGIICADVMDETKKAVCRIRAA